MSKTINLQDFKGMRFNEGLWQEGFSKYCVGMDVWGLRDNGTRPSIPGVLQPMRGMIAGTEAASTNDITDLITSMAYNPADGSVYGFSNTATPRLYQRSGSTWTNTSYAPATVSTASGGGGMLAFNNNLWFCTNARVIRNASGVYSDFLSFTTGGVSPRPMKVFAAKLFIGNDRYISSIDATPTGTAIALTLPLEFTVKAMEVFAANLYIFADTGKYTRVFIWDGIATTFNSYVDLISEASAPRVIANDGMLWCIATRGEAVGGNIVYVFNGYQFTVLMNLPASILNNNYYGIGVYNGGVIFSATDTSTADYEDGTAGIWMIARRNPDEPYTAGIAFAPAAGVTTETLGAIYCTGRTLYVASLTGANYQVWEDNGDSVQIGGTTPSNSVWQSLPIDAGNISNKAVWTAIQLNSELDIDTSRSIVIKYRLDYATAWTTLATVSTNSARYIPIGRSSKVIELRFEITASGSSTTRLHGVGLEYQETTA